MKKWKGWLVEVGLLAFQIWIVIGCAEIIQNCQTLFCQLGLMTVALIITFGCIVPRCQHIQKHVEGDNHRK